MGHQPWRALLRLRNRYGTVEKRGKAPLTLTTLFIVFSFLFGIVIGSFLNVCITRIPEDVSIVAPASRCPKCGTPIKPYDNVPVFSWLWLRGKCRGCGTPISPMYPLVELVTGLLFVACYLQFGLTQATVKWVFFTCLIIVLAITDLRVRLLPDLVTWPGFAVGLLFSAVVPLNDGAAFLLASKLFHRLPPPRLLGVLDALLGALFGSLLLWGAATVYKVVRHREGMGFGDVKMMAMAGTFLGVGNTFLTILLGTLLGSVIGVALIMTMYLRGVGKQLAERASRRGLGSVNGIRWAIASQYQLPLGTFLGIAALIVVLSSFSLDAITRLR
jgi:leader peptidase (prepilin peptidase)/N-methyltransferase